MDHSCLEQDHDSLVRLQGHLEQVKRIKQDNDLKTIAVVELKKKVNELLGEREKMATAFVLERDKLQSKEREGGSQLLELGTRLAAAEDALRTTREELHAFQLASAQQVNGVLHDSRTTPSASAHTEALPWPY
jgi:DNA repair exonuclease SbcCD ATPase subunit